MLMTADGSGDDKIKLQGLGAVTFSDGDGGSVGNPSDDDDEAEMDPDFETGRGSGAMCDDDYGPSDAESELTDDAASYTGDDDTDLLTIIGEAWAPPGFVVDDAVLEHPNDVIGRQVMCILDTLPLLEPQRSWFQGAVKKQLTQAQKESPLNTDCDYLVTFKNKETNDVVATAHGYPEKRASVTLPRAINQSTRGENSRWILLKKVARSH